MAVRNRRSDKSGISPSPAGTAASRGTATAASAEASTATAASAAREEEEKDEAGETAAQEDPVNDQKDEEHQGRQKILHSKSAVFFDSRT